MNFASDNTGPAHPKVMEALARANDGHAKAYGADPVTVAAQERIREIFEAPEAAVHFVSTGTAANSLLLATLSEPWETIFASEVAHIQEDECNAPEAFTGGTKITLLPSSDGRLEPGALRARIASEQSRGVHGPQRGPVSLTQATEKGAVHGVHDLAALGAVAKDFGLSVHMDGARFANALVSLGCTPAEMTHGAGVDAVSFGGTKNGCLAVEAAILFDPALSWEFELRRKRAAHLFSKHRFLSAQMAAYLEGDLWLEMASAANAACARLAAGLRQVPGVSFLAEPQANIVFAHWPRRLHRKLLAAGATYYVWSGDPSAGDPEEPLLARLVTNWTTTGAEVDRFLSEIT